jgi:cytochrome c oxidase cbb3-type subunit 3
MSQKGQFTICRSRADLRCSGKFSLLGSLIFTAALATYPARQNPELKTEKPAGKTSSPQAQGQQSFESHCAPCHGLDGHGGEFAHAIATPGVAGALDNSVLFQIIRGGIPPQGMPSFNSLSESEVRSIITYVRLLTGQSAARPEKGSSVKGEKLYFGKARCGDCHMILGKGGFIGADLTNFVRSHSRDDLHQVIISPDQWISPAANVVTVTTLSQERVAGLVRNEDNFSLQLLDRDGVFHLFLKSQIVKVDREPHPLMPGDYATRLTPAELDDLLSFLFSGSPASAQASSVEGPSARQLPQKKPPKTGSK